MNPILLTQPGPAIQLHPTEVQASSYAILAAIKKSSVPLVTHEDMDRRQVSMSGSAPTNTRSVCVESGSPIPDT